MVAPVSRFSSGKNEAECRADALDYFGRVKNGDLTPPTKEAHRYIAAKMDEAAFSAYDSLKSVLVGSREHEQRVATLEGQPRLRGPIGKAKILFRGDSAFEQTIALEEWEQQHAGRTKQHTFCFASGEEGYIPVYAKPGSLMHVVLGNTNGDHKAPRYSEWAQTDPRNTLQARFIAPLEALENARQPHFVGATLVKGNAFEKGVVEEDWRYGEHFACVEDKGQSRATKKKLQSAGLNLTNLTSQAADEEDPKALGLNISAEVLCENYLEDGYNDNFEFKVTPGGMIAATEKAIIKDDITDLERQMRHLFIAKMGPPSTPSLRQYIVKEFKEEL